MTISVFDLFKVGSAPSSSHTVRPMKAAQRIALRGDGRHFVSLDIAINTRRVTGRDTLDKYKETSRGGLAVCVIEC